MKKYTFTGNHKKNNIYEKYYTSQEFINKNIINIFKNFKENNHLSGLHFIDTSAGDNRLVKILMENKLIESYKSFDISFSNSFGEIELKNWIGENYSTLKKYDKHSTLKKYDKHSTLKKYDKTNTLIGFNPPYGYNNKTAKKFIQKAWEEKHKYCIWLVPNSVKPYLLERYKELHASSYTNIAFIDTSIVNNKTIKQSVMLFIGERRSKILSKIKKQKSIPKYNYSIERKHYKGIADNVSLIIKKTGNPVLFPLFYKKGKYWTQYYKREKVTDKAEIVEKDGKKYMRGISKNKNGWKVFDYAVESNVYFRISNIENIIDIEKLVEKLVEIGNSEEFFKHANKYKPASITQGWFIDYLNKLLDMLEKV